MRTEGIRKVFTFALVALCPAAIQAFGGEDLLKGPWHHRHLSRDAATTAKWEPAAADAMAWHAERVDDYLYSPLWWIQGGLDRYRISRNVKHDLEKLHFDDLFSTPRVEAAWHRYASSTLAGLLWASERGDVAAAQCLVGLSLHAFQDFYSHSNWVDDPARRTSTFSSTPFRPATALYTGFYEQPGHSGIKPHGKPMPACSIMNMAAVKAVMEAGCAKLPIPGRDDLCKQYLACRDGVALQPTVQGVTVPGNLVYYAPPGMALDASWMADVAAKVRGITDIPGEQAFKSAYTLAGHQSVGWLTRLDHAMAKLGANDFWARVKREAPSEAERQAQYEKLGRIPFTFLTAGPYQPVQTTPEWYLRVRIKTSGEADSGTDSDIRLRAGGRDDLLDYGRDLGLIVGYNDFERGDDDVYVVGPYSSVPSQIELYNDAANAGEIFGAIWRSFVSGVESVINSIKNIFKSLLGTEADHIQTNKIVWMPQDLNFPYGQTKDFSIDLNGGTEGHYIVHGTLKKVWDDPAFDGFEVTVTRLQCVRESDVDQASDDDEPFLLMLLSPLPGDDEAIRTEPYASVHSGHWRDVNRKFRGVRVPKHYGILSLAISGMEHDDESSSKRDQLLREFAGRVSFEHEPEKRSLTQALGTVIAGDWKVEHLDVYAFSSYGTVHGGTVLDQRVDRLVKTRSGATFGLDPSKVRSSGVPTNDLLFSVIKLGNTGFPLPKIGPIIKPVDPPIKPPIKR